MFIALEILLLAGALWGGYFVWNALRAERNRLHQNIANQRAAIEREMRVETQCRDADWRWMNQGQQRSQAQQAAALNQSYLGSLSDQQQLHNAGAASRDPKKEPETETTHWHTGFAMCHETRMKGDPNKASRW